MAVWNAVHLIPLEGEVRGTIGIQILSDSSEAASKAALETAHKVKEVVEAASVLPGGGSSTTLVVVKKAPPGSTEALAFVLRNSLVSSVEEQPMETQPILQRRPSLVSWLATEEYQDNRHSRGNEYLLRRADSTHGRTLLRRADSIVTVSSILIVSRAN